MDNPACNTCLKSAQDLIFHGDGVLNDQITVVLSLPEKHLSDKKPYADQAWMKLEQLMDLDPQFNLDTSQLGDKDVQAFNTWLWDQMAHQSKLHMKKHMVAIINEHLNFFRK